MRRIVSKMFQKSLMFLDFVKRFLIRGWRLHKENNMCLQQYTVIPPITPPQPGPPHFFLVEEHEYLRRKLNFRKKIPPPNHHFLPG